jgi:hypothetical protein
MDTSGGPYKTEFVDGVFRSYHNHSKEDAPKYGARLRDAVMTPVNWPTVTATEARQGFQDRSRGMKGSQESLTTVVVKSGLAARDNLNTSGSRQESWATPQSREFRSAEGNADRWKNPERSRNLNDQIQAWATPAARDWKGQSSSPGYQKQDLNDQIKAWATPNAFCFQPPENTEQWQKRAAIQQEKGVNLHKPVQSQVLHENEKVVGAMPPSAMKLNPRWVETLMGLEVGWVMPSCQNPITPQGEESPSHGGGQLDDPGSAEQHGIPDQQWQEDPASWEPSHPDLFRSCDNRTDELRLLGNGVVPATAELAFRTLWEELTWK